jgi:hypothetical protein
MVEKLTPAEQQANAKSRWIARTRAGMANWQAKTKKKADAFKSGIASFLGISEAEMGAHVKKRWLNGIEKTDVGKMMGNVNEETANEMIAGQKEYYLANLEE